MRQQEMTPSVLAQIVKAVRAARHNVIARVLVTSQFEVSDAQLLTLLRLEDEGKIEMAVL